VIGEDPQKACGETIRPQRLISRLFLKSRLPTFASQHPSIEFYIAKQANAHPIIRGVYRTNFLVAWLNRSEWTGKSNLCAKSRSTSNSEKGRTITRFEWQETEKNHKKGRDG
jgi:Mitochondrial ribosomal protein L51 / S25 / CI-B8 domain